MEPHEFHPRLVDGNTLRRAAWDGQVPIAFVLAETDVTALRPPDPVYVMAPRMSYLPLAAKIALDHFRESAPALAKEHLWFDSEGVPLKWNLPVGVLFDLFGLASSLPWRVVVHLQRIPSDELLRFSSEEELESLYYNSIKQALYLRQGTTKTMQTLPKSQQQQLWDALKTVSYGQFWEVNEALLERVSDVRHVPVRLVSRRFPTVQRPIPPVLPDGANTTLADMLRMLAPTLLTPHLTTTAARADAPERARAATEDVASSAPTGTAHALTPPRASDAASDAASGDAAADWERGDSPSNRERSASVGGAFLADTLLQGRLPAGARVLVQGVEVPLDVPLLELADAMSHPDNFLYVCVVR